MRRLHGILPILCLLLAIYQVLGQDCWPSSEKRCVPRHKCRDGIQFRVMTGGNNGCPAPETCCQNIHILNDVPDIIVEETVNPECGRPNSRGVSFEVPKMDGFAQEFEFPWMVALLDASGNYLGGGAIISPELVITAKHVTDNLTEDQLIVRAGDWDLKTNSEHFPHIDARIRSIVRHPGFDKNNGANNVALLFLRTPLKFTQHIKPICLPPDNRNFDYSRCIFSGWGKKSFDDFRYMNLLKKVDLPIVKNNECEYQLRRFYGNEFQLDNSLLCAGGEPGKDSCKGDGGSPLACPLREDPQRYELAGIVNFGVNCGMQDVPAVYTHVAKLRNWIVEETNNNLNGYGPKPETTPENTPPPFNSHQGVPTFSSPNRSPGLAFPGQRTSPQYPRYQPIVPIPTRPPVQVSDFGWVANEQQSTERNTSPPSRPSTGNTDDEFSDMFKKKFDFTLNE